MLKKPERRTTKARNKSKSKQLLDLVNCHEMVITALKVASTKAIYSGSPYHRPAGSKMGMPKTRRYPHASKCDPKWDRQSATAALRAAIKAGTVSAAFEGHYPRYAWHKDDDVIYEARLTNSQNGEYHAYPLEDKRQWPHQ